MTTTLECESGDLYTSSSLEKDFGITEDQGVPIADLKRVELARVRSIFQNHLHDHVSHSAIYKFTIPEGYEERNNIIYKSR